MQDFKTKLKKFLKKDFWYQYICKGAKFQEYELLQEYTVFRNVDKIKLPFW